MFSLREYATKKWGLHHLRPSWAVLRSLREGVEEFRFAHLKPHAYTRQCTAVNKQCARLTLHRVFGPSGPFLHSGLSVLPHVTQTCPSPSVPPVTAPLEDCVFKPDMLVLFVRFFSRASRASLVFGCRPGRDVLASLDGWV